ncbi:hypothetical protein NGB36_24140 [Streptomyces sp. RB6PN25]|uniref:Proline rich protein membrane protein n=1 Tax=Streptomyces humicola TaxID=2953240 RepID=A0ABT1Q139_9ACTN|nr:hypothetical protein [Streptomyces humicola]MCQ4083604.1 hypothetical protein [Streptomyces humicola]
MRPTGPMPAMPGAWRWRPNPLRRRSDVVEAWAGLATAAVVAVGAPAAGLATGRTVGYELQRTVRLQHAQRHLVPATVLSTSARTVPAVSADGDSTDGQDTVRSAVVRWTAPDGTVRTGTIHIVLPRQSGDRVPVWIDTRGVLTGRPMDRSTATTNAVAAGLGVAAGVASFACGMRQLLGWRILRRRLADWERAWARLGQDWGRAGAGG